MALKVAIIGLWSETHDLAPWADPEWQKWGLAWDALAVRMDRVFEIHAQSEWAKYVPRDYIERLQTMARLYLQELHPDIPHAERYPLEGVIESVGDYLSSSIAYLMALAIHEGAQEISLWGVEMDAHEEYGYQRPNMEYLIGLARGRGIKVHIHAKSGLCKYRPQLGYVGRYGWLG